ncbi:MAG: calcium/sodium antiporter, partial [Gammaproteobacteria bacterium]
MLNLFLLLLGLTLLTLGGEALIRGSLGAARHFGVSPLLSGLVIVGFGTSAPELVVSVEAALANQPDIALGNVVGSNIANILLILGTCALITPLAVRPLALRRDAVTVVAASLLFLVLAGGGVLGLTDALILLMCLATYLVWAYWSEKYQHVAAAEVHLAEGGELTAVPKPLLITVLLSITGLLLLIGGSHVLIKGATGLAESLGVSQALIGLTVVAVGTSLPEFSISVIAALRRHADVAVGNILGSNIFNLLGILGVSALLQPLPVHARIQQYDQWVMLGAAILLLLFLYTGQRLSRLEGVLLLAGYGCYIGL